MKKITLLGTRHQESGTCNLKYLLYIIGNIAPEVIFEEMPPSEYKNYYVTKDRDRLESDAIIEYAKNHQCENIQVDLEFDPTAYLSAIRKVHLRVEANSFDYRRSCDWNVQYAKKYGFAYLNSEHCEKLHFEINDSIVATLRKLEKDELNAAKKLYDDIDEQRENEMLSNIYNYCEEHDFEKGLFMIGAGHRKSIIEKIEKRPIAGITWNYDNYEGIL